MTKLKELLTEKELLFFEESERKGISPIVTTKEFRNLTVDELNHIGLTIFREAFDSRCPAGCISANAIEVLTDRSIKRGLSLYQ